MKSNKPHLPPEVIEFANSVGDFIEYWGFKNIQGQFWAYLYLSAEPLDATELIRRTEVSKGLASVYLKEMLEYKVIEEAGKGPFGTNLYRATANQDKVIFNVLRKRERSMLGKVRAAWDQCMSIPAAEKEMAGISEKGLNAAGKLIASAITVLDLVIRSHESIESIVSKIKKTFSNNIVAK